MDHVKEGYNTKFTSTTIETRSVHDFPFPAVTFYPGDENTAKGFLRAFLNNFQLTRYDGEALGDNEKFIKLFEWLIGPMTHELFDGIEKYLLNEKVFIQKKGKIFRNEVCGLIALQQLRKTSLKKDMRKIYKLNMYKYVDFSVLLRFIKKEISPFITIKTKEYNLTKSEISTACNDAENLQSKSEMEARHEAISTSL